MSETAQALGQRLKAAREQRGVSAQKMADDMHLDGWVIEALEAGEYDRIGPSVYAKGYLRKYASILGIAAAPAESSEPKAAPAGPQTPIPIVRIDPPSRIEGLWPKVGGVAAIVLIAGGFAWWRLSHRTAAVAPGAALPAPPSLPAAAPLAARARVAGPAAPEAVPPVEAEPAAEAIPATEAMHTAEATPTAAAMPPAAAMPAAVAAPPAAAPQPAAQDLTPGVGHAHLRLSFSADSRVDVYDYSGKAIFTGNGRANSVKTLAGMAPFRVYLGSASGVQLEVNDRAVAIGRQFVTGDVARFEAGADGVLRRDTRPSSTNGTQTAAASPRG